MTPSEPNELAFQIGRTETSIAEAVEGCIAAERASVSDPDFATALAHWRIEATALLRRMKSIGKWVR